MNLSTPSGPVLGLTIALVVTAMITDVRRRRIPNALTFPAMGLGLVLHAVEAGGRGALLGLAGMVATPCLLMIVRAFRPLGMGDVKLCAAVGALLGPVLGAIAMLLSALLGGVLALVWTLRPGTQAGWTVAPFLVGLPILGRLWSSARPADANAAPARLPYGVAIGCGSLLALGVAAWS